jgi:hypothetical protein
MGCSQLNMGDQDGLFMTPRWVIRVVGELISCSEVHLSGQCRRCSREMSRAWFSYPVPAVICRYNTFKQTKIGSFQILWLCTCIPLAGSILYNFCSVDMNAKETEFSTQVTQRAVAFSRGYEKTSQGVSKNFSQQSKRYTETAWTLKQFWSSHSRIGVLACHKQAQSSY